VATLNKSKYEFDLNQLTYLMKSVLSPSKLSAYPGEFRAKLETLKAEKSFLQSKSVNVEVRDANLSELFIFYDNAFFDCQLEGKVILEWSVRMT
jgi:hypothetical protein